MARTTRSATTQEKEKSSEPAQTSRKSAARKRKRNSIVDGAEQPATKQSRMDEDMKEETSPDPEEPQATGTAQTELLSSGDVPVSPEDAEKILEILEMVDTQGLLDRVFPLSTEHGLGSDSGAGPSTGTQSYSFRALLKSSSSYPLRVLRSAVQHLLPISSHPRSRPSATAAEQLRFCTLALSLLDQASFHSSPIPLDVESLLSGPVDEDETQLTASSTRTPSVQRKYALIQKLPTGDWWSSIAASYPSLLSEGKDLKDLPTAYTDLVAVLPTPSLSVIEPPTLGAYVKKSVVKQRTDVTAPRRVACGRYLNYGPYTSFAPVFEQAGVEVGCVQLGEVIWRRGQERWRKRRNRQLEEWSRKQEAVSLTASDGLERDEVVEIEQSAAKQKDKMKEVEVEVEVDSALDELLLPEQIDTLKASLGSLELERAVQELLDRNARALRRLEELQLVRLRNGGALVEVGSEEWETAQGIYDSLTVLASLRPRSSDADVAPLIPSASALHKLHRTLPVGKTEGWYGTLPAGRASALRDDITIHIRNSTSVTTPAPAPNPPATANSTSAPKTPGSTYGGYAYPGYTTSAQYRASYGAYTPAQTSSYYASYNATQTPAPTQYTSQYGTTGQQPYAYSSWYNYQPTPAMTAPSGRATPQASATPAASVLQNYPNYYSTSNTQQQPQPQRAVANTVLSAASNKTYQQGTWSNGTASPHVPPTLPPHLRTSTTAPSTPGTPTPISATTPYQGYYAGNYQAATAVAR